MPSSAAMLLRGYSGWPYSASLSPESDRTSPSSTRVTVMVVDDDPRVRRLTARMLRSEGYDVLEAGSGEEALERLAAARNVQVVLTDIIMPGMHGLELAESVLAYHPKRQIVLMSGYAPNLLVQLGIRESRFPVLMKPFTAEELASQMRQVLMERPH